jgi:hypothetical protein
MKKKILLQFIMVISFPILLSAQWEYIYTLETGHQLNNIKFFNDETGFLLGTQALLLKTEDGGDSWDEILFPSSFSSMADVYIYGSNKIVGLGIDDPPSIIFNQFQVSYNSGGAWIPVDEDILAATSFDFQLPNLSLGYCGSMIISDTSFNCGIYKLIDVGLNTQSELVWDEGLAGTVNHILAIDDQVVVASCQADYPDNSFILRSNDQGTNWNKTLQLEPLNWFRKLDVSVDGNCVYALSWDSVFYSMNQGVSWEGHPCELRALDLISRQEAYGVSETSGFGSFVDTFNLSYTNDAWQTWRVQHKNPFDVMMIDQHHVLQMVNENTGYWAWNNQVYKTINGGFVAVPENQQTAKYSLSISPNPAHNRFKIEIPGDIHKGSVIVYNNLGAIVKEQVFSVSGQAIQIITSSWPAGIYQVAVIGKQGETYSGKVIIK